MCMYGCVLLRQRHLKEYIFTENETISSPGPVIHSFLSIFPLLCCLAASCLPSIQFPFSLSSTFLPLSPSITSFLHLSTGFTIPHSSFPRYESTPCEVWAVKLWEQNIASIKKVLTPSSSPDTAFPPPLNTPFPPLFMASGGGKRVHLLTMTLD